MEKFWRITSMEEKFYHDVRDSFVLAMQQAGVLEHQAKQIAEVVDDYVANYYGD